MGVPAGFHAFHADRNINYQLNRALLEGRLEDIQAAAPRIRDYADWKREMLALAETAERDGRTLNAFAYHRAAEFFMAVDDPDRERAFRLLVNARSVTGRLFTEAEGAAEHCQFGNLELARDTIVRWIDERTRSRGVADRPASRSQEIAG